VSKYHDVEQMSGHARNAVISTKSLADYIKQTRAHGPGFLGPLDTFGRSSLIFLRHSVHAWDSSPKVDIRAALAPPDSGHRSAFVNARNLLAQFHNLAVEHPEAANDNHARAYQGIRQRWREICAAMPQAMVDLADLHIEPLTLKITEERQAVLNAVFLEMVAAARKRFNKQDELTAEKIREVCLAAAEAVAMASKYRLTDDPAIDLLNEVAGAY
jgi:hypothetical protein